MGKTKNPVCREQLEFLQQIYNNRSQRGSIHFAEIREYLTESVLAELSAHPLIWMPLLKLSRKISTSGKFDFWRTVFRARAVLPQKTLLEFWYECYNDKADAQRQLVDTPDGQVFFCSNVRDPKLLETLAFTDPLLIDNGCVTFRYCQAQKPGWELLRHRLYGRRHQTLHLAGPLREALETDSVPGFRMMMDMTGQEISFSLLYEIVNKNAYNIFRYLFIEDHIPERVISHLELAAWFTMAFYEEKAIALLSLIEEKRPGFLKSCHDPLGRNLLWYVVYNHFTSWFHPNCRLAKYLCDCGCDPENKNQLGLSWRYIADNLPRKQKIQQMKSRYHMASFHQIPGTPLEKLQPYSAL